MSFRRRHRWFRRFALGLALVTASLAHVSLAAAKVDQGGSASRYVSTEGWSGPVDMETGIPLSAGIDETLLAGAPAVTGEPAASKAAVAVAASPVAAQARPDDRADRFALSDVSPRPETASSGEWTFERGDALIIVIGGTVLALGLGLALGYLRRPRIAGL